MREEATPETPAPALGMRMHDGMFVPSRYTTIEKGDNAVTNIAAASILAKVERDNYIAALCRETPMLDERYGLLKNKGYGTSQHRVALANLGPCAVHRLSFAPLRELAAGEDG